jgi:transcriptional regulator with XRE-family HTH domain
VTESVQELKSLLAQMNSGRLTWQGFLLGEKESRNLSNARIAARAGVTRQAFEKWLNRGVLPDSRDAFLKLGMALDMGLNGINRMLARYGTYPQLYPKNAHDAVCVYVIGRYSQGKADSEPYRDYPFGRVEALEALLNQRLEAGVAPSGEGDLPTEQAREGAYLG